VSVAAVPAARPSRATVPDRRDGYGSAGRPTLRGVVRRGLGRGLAAGVGTALAAGLLVGVTPTVPSTAPAPLDAADLAPVAAAAPSPEFRTFSLNVAFPLSVERAKADMRKAMTRLGAAAGGFQEMSQKADRQSLMELARELDWGWYMPIHQGMAIPVVFDRSRFRLVSGRSVMTHGAEEGVTPSRWINVVRLRETATGKIFGIINTHAISQASRDAQASDMHRIPRLRRHLAMLREEMLDLFATTEHLVAMGDLNVNYLADRRRQVAGLPTRAFGDIVDFDMPLEGSRGRRSLLDYTMSMKHGSGLSRSTGEIVRGFNSDHDAVVVTYTPVDVFETGPLTNAPNGGVHAQRTVLEAWERAIGDTEPGAVLRVATSRLADDAVTDALLAAAERGVAVRLLINGKPRTEQEQRLATAIGQDVEADSWVRPAGLWGSKATFLLVDRTGGTTTLTISSSTALTEVATDTLADAWRTSFGGVYEEFLAAFDRLAAGEEYAGPVAGNRVGGGYRVLFHPVAETGTDPFLKALGPIQCHRAQGPRNVDGVTQVRISVNAWGGERGLAIAERIAGKAGLGCDVRVLAGPWTGQRVVATLRAAGVQVQRAPTTQNLLLVDGRYGRHANRQLTWTGSGSWAPGGTKRVAQTVRIVGEQALLPYRDQFDGRWAQG
jgi:endonuclease/exonuclease/phosphatase family metal-dependent hydrolase